MARCKLAIFDFDGTLANSFPWFVDVLNGVADRYGFNRVQPDDVERLRGLDARRIMHHLRVPVWKLPVIATHMRGLMARDIDRIRLFDGVPDLLRALEARGVTVAIVSSNAESNVRHVLGAENAARVAHFGCGSALFGKHARFRACLCRTGIPAGQAIAIGDEGRDIEAARRAGMACGAVTWGYARAETLAALSPDLLFDRVGEIADRIA